LATLDPTHEAVDIQVTALVMLQMLFQFEGLSAPQILAFKNSIWQLNPSNYNLRTYMSPNVSLEVPSFSELSLASDERAVQEPFVISLFK
jgi:hypothetical protein